MLSWSSGSYSACQRSVPLDLIITPSHKLKWGSFHIRPKGSRSKRWTLSSKAPSSGDRSKTTLVHPCVVYDGGPRRRRLTTVKPASVSVKGRSSDDKIVILIEKRGFRFCKGYLGCTDRVFRDDSFSAAAVFHRNVMGTKAVRQYVVQCSVNVCVLLFV